MAEKVSKTIVELQKIHGAINELTAEVRTLSIAIRQVLGVVQDHETRLTHLEQ